MYKQLVILILLVALAQAGTKLAIISVSSSPNSVLNPVYSSLKGGREVYINAVGHSKNPSQIQVKVGPYPCLLLDEGVSSDYIVCKTVDSGLTTSSSNLPVSLTSKKETVVSVYPHVVIYSSGYTPSIKEVFPSSSYAGETIAVEGTHRTSDVGSNELEVGQAKVKVGEDVCNRYLVSQGSVNGGSSNQKLNCQQSDDKEAGKYKIQTEVESGISEKNKSNKKASLEEDDDFEFTTLPAVKNVTNKGNEGGQEIEIEGSGFSTKKQNNTVTVDGNQCEVTESTNNKIKCKLNKKDQNKTARLSTNDTDQTKGYFSGVGLHYVRYSSCYTSSIFGFVSTVRSNPDAMPKAEESVKTELRSGDIYGSYFGETWKGYFTAPVSGTYTFRGWGEYAFSLYLSEVSGSAELPSQPLIYSTSSQQAWDNFFYFNVPTASANVDLVEGESYYLQAFHISYYYIGKFKIFVEVPNSNKNLSSQVYHVDQIYMTTDVQPEVMVYSMIEGSQGLIDLRLIRTDSSGKITYNRNVTVSYGCSQYAFLSAMYSFDSFYNYMPSVRRFMYDSVGNITQMISEAEKIDYQVSLYLKRPDNYQQEEFIFTPFGYDGTFEQSQTIPHSPLIQGTFSINIGGTELYAPGIPYNIADISLQDMFRKIPGLQNVEVAQRTSLGYTYDSTWIISYKGYKDLVPPLIINAASLTGGITSPQVTHTVLRNYTGSVVFEPVDYRFINTADEQPNVLVTVNEIPAVCVTNCSYNFIDMFKIINMSMVGAKLVLIATKPAALSVTAGQIKVKIAGLEATVNFTANETHICIECMLQTNPDGTPILPAGTLEPEVYIQQAGYVQADSGSVDFIEVPFVVNSLQQTSGTNNGGYLNTIVGSGFVGVGSNKDVSSAKGSAAITVTLCNKTAVIKTVANQKIVFQVPQCDGTGPYPVNVSDGTFFDADKSFTYQGPEISVMPSIVSIAPTTSNPKLKSLINITGVHFGSNISAARVFLVNKESLESYELRILSLNDTLIRCGLPGGLGGRYSVQVKFDILGDSVVSGVNQFSYVFQIDSVSPSTGSYYGGTLLTITGQNFLTGSGETLAYIGDAINWFCKIQTLTSTEITCLTPPFYPDYKIADPQQVLISSKLTSFSDCPANNCNFTYMNASDCANLTNISTTTISGGSVLFFSGYNFTSSSDCNITFRHTLTNKVTILRALNCFATTANVTIPKDLVSGKYYVSVKNSFGDSNPLILNVTWVIGYMQNFGSTEGAFVTMSGGSGYPEEISGDYKLSITSSANTKPVEIISCCQNNLLKMFIPPSPNGTVYTFIFSHQLRTYFSYFTAQSSAYYTPSFSITSPSPLTVDAGYVYLILKRTSSIDVPITNVTIRSVINSTEETVITNFDNIAGGITNFSAILNSGSYKIYANSSRGYYLNNQTLNVKLNSSTSVPSQQASFAGGSLTITGDRLSQSSFITVNGFRGNLIEHNTAWVKYQIPKFVNTIATSEFQKIKLIPGELLSYFSDTTHESTVQNSFDSNLMSYYESYNPKCWVGVDVGLNLMLAVDRIKFYPRIDWKASTVSNLLGSTFQGSNDMVSWTTLASIDQTVHSGWNTFKSKTSTPFRYVRFSHNQSSKCSMAEIQLYGIIYSNQTNNYSSVTYFDGFNSRTYPSVVNYSVPQTPIVTAVDPPYGDTFGGYTLQLTGNYLGSNSNVQILIDNVPCVYVSSNGTELVCTVGARATPPDQNTFVVLIEGRRAYIKQEFMYVLKWSDPRTWGTDLPPIDGDIIYVPAGQTLLVDQDTPHIEGIAVKNGTLIFSNSTSITVKTGFITMVGGRFIAGTEENPHHANLVFEMYGGYYGAQQPMAGNKGIFCLDCKFSMYGKPRSPTWTTLSDTITPGSLSFNVSQAVDWQVGEKIVVASTSFNPAEAEQKTITSISGQIVTVDSPFKFKHSGFVETQGSDSINMQAEVGLLTRNIKITGDSSTPVSKYGAHLKLSGTEDSGFEGKVAYSEFTLCGQPQIPGRYCLYYHMNEEIPASLARGNSFHETYGRAVTLRGVSMLSIEQNVAYRARGHNFYFEDGTEIHNRLYYNLAINSLAVSDMYYTDLAVASFLVRNPANEVVDNRAAGSDFYGLWLDFPSRVTGASAQSDICPDGIPLGLISGNVIHSNKMIGMRIQRLLPRTYPCSSVRNTTDSEDQWRFNPSIPSVISNFTIYKNEWYGVLAEETGNLAFENFIVAQNYKSGIEFYNANFTKENVKVKNSVFIGKTSGNNDGDSTKYSQSMAGLTTPRSGSINIENVRFYAYPSGSYALAICSKCASTAYFTNLGTEVYVSSIYFSGVDGKALTMLGLKRDVIYNLDNSLTSLFNISATGTSLSNGTILYSWPHIANAQTKHCFPPINSSLWDGAMFCDGSLKIRRVYFTNVNRQFTIAPYTFFTYSGFISYSMYFVPIANESISGPLVNSSLWTSVGSSLSGSEPSIEKWLAWSLPFVAGSKYAAWWSSNYDFNHLSIVTTTLFKEDDPGIVFKFGYTTSRELFNVGPMRSGAMLTSANYMPQSVNYLNPQTCSNGDYYHNNDPNVQLVSICQSGKNRTKFQYTEVNAVFCKYLCPKPEVKYSSSCDPNSKESFIRLWNNASMWPGEVIPKAGDNVTILCDWTVLINIDPEPMNFFIVDGDVVVDDSRDINVTAKAIHIRAGSLTVGSSDTRFVHKFTFQLNGGRYDSYYGVDPLLMANKLFVVTGSLALYGKTPSSISTYLTSTASKGSNTIYVGSSSDWKEGDSLALYPSFSNTDQHEEVTITSVNTDGSVSISPVLAYTHFGSSSSTLSTSYGNLDARTRVVHLSRNIRIVSGPDYTHGFTLFVYKYYDGNNLRLGNLVAEGVEFRNGGQTTIANAAVQFMNLIGSIATNSIAYSSFAGCGARCLNVYNSQNITVQNNAFFRASGASVIAQGANLRSFAFRNNVMGGVVVGQGIDACFILTEDAESSRLISVKDNICQGSQGYGFVLPHVRCRDVKNHSLTNNLAGSCSVGFALTEIDLGCQAFSYLQAYACGIGQIAGPKQTAEVIYSNFVLADNQRGATLKFGGLKNSLDNTATFNDSYITALSRPTCSQCYGQTQTKCKQLVGLRMLSVSENGGSISIDFNTLLDVINRPEAVDAKVFMHNVIFDNFKQNYSSGYANTVTSNCGSNFAFRSHPLAIDATAGHYLSNCQCQNCDNDSFIKCDGSSQINFVNQGGCGQSECTGKSNYLLQDWDGTFFGFKGVVLPNNKAIGDNEDNCVWSQAMNGHLCHREDFVILEYDSRAPDYNTRSTWPVTLKGQVCNYTTVTNGWRDWQWSGSIPQNKRLGRFLSIVKLLTQYNMTFASMPPLDMSMQLQRRSPEGNASNYVILRIYYPIPNSIRVFVAGSRKSPIINTDVSNYTHDGLRRTMDTASCGDNVYFYNNRTIKLILTEEPGCLVKISVTDSIQLTTHFSMAPEDFFVDTVMSNFIDNLCALLGIVDQARVKIVGVHSGSAIIDTVIEAENSTESSAGADSSMAEISTALTSIINNGTFAAVMESNVGYPVLSATGQFYVLPVTDPDAPTEEVVAEQKKKDISVLIGIIAGAVVIMLVIFITIYCIYKKRMAMQEAIVAQSSFEKDRVEQVQSNQKQQSHNIIMSDSVFFAQVLDSPPKDDSPSPQKKKPRNRRVRNRQHLQIREYD